MSIHFEEQVPINKMKGVGGFFILKKQKVPSYENSDVSILKLSSAKEGKQKVETLKTQEIDSINNLNDHILTGNDLKNVDMSRETMEASKRQKTDSKNLPKSKRTKRKDMEIFKSNFFK